MKFYIAPVTLRVRNPSSECHSQLRHWVCHSRNSAWGRNSSLSCPRGI